MADTDRYSSNRPHFGGGGGRKRRYQDFDDGPGHSGPPGHHGGGHHGGGGRPFQRRRFDPPGTRLRKKLLALLDTTFQTPEQEIAEIAGIATQHAHDEYVRDTFVDLVVSLAVEQPGKIVFLAALVERVNRKDGGLVGELLGRVAALVEREVRRGAWRVVKLGLRLLGSLQGVFREGESVLGVLEELFQRTIDLQGADPEETTGLELVKVILLTVPYLMASSPSDELKAKVDELLDKTEIVAMSTHALESVVDPYPADDAGQKAMACPSLLSLLQTQLKNEASQGWPLACIPRVNFEATAQNGNANGSANGDANGETNGDADMTEEPTLHAFPTIKIPETINPGQRALFPELYYSVFADQEIESVPPTSSIASTIIRDVIVDTINALDYNRNFIGKFIIDVDNYWAPGTFVKRATPFDKLREVPADKPTWKPEDMAIDAVFSQLMQLPSPHHKTVYYHSIIFEACKNAPSAIAPSLGRAIRFTFRTLSSLDLELVQRFIDWFAHHVSNFEFRWKWAEWLPDADLSPLHPKKAFIYAAIDKEIRLAFPKRIADSLPPEFAALIPKGQYNDEPDYKFSKPETPYAQQGQALYTILKDKSSGDAEIAPVLDEVRALASAQGVDPDIAATDAFVTSICHIGSKSLSHVLSAIDRNRERLLSIGPANEAARRHIITAVMSYWQHHPGQAVNIVDKLLNYTIVTPAAVIEWALADHLAAGRALARHDVYEMVASTMNKVARRVGEIAAARANPDILRTGNTEHIAVIEDTLVRERNNMRDLFRQIEDSVGAVAAGADDGMVGADASEGGEGVLLQGWGAKWSRTWRRRALVEEMRSGEAGVNALVEVLRLVGEVEAEVREEEEEEKRKREEAKAKREEERRKRYEGNGEDQARDEKEDDGRGRTEGREKDGEDEVL